MNDLNLLLNKLDQLNKTNKHKSKRIEEFKSEVELSISCYVLWLELEINRFCQKIEGLIEKTKKSK